MTLYAQLVIKGDEAAAAAMVPSYMVGMPDPRDAPTMQMLSFYKFFTDSKDQEGLTVRRLGRMEQGWVELSSDTRQTGHSSAIWQRPCSLPLDV